MIYAPLLINKNNKFFYNNFVKNSGRFSIKAQFTVEIKVTSVINNKEN